MFEMNRYMVVIGNAFVREYDEDMEYVELVADINKGYQFPDLSIARSITNKFGGRVWKLELMYLTDTELMEIDEHE